MTRSRIILRVVGIVCVATACATVPAGCQAKLMPSPTVFVDSGIDPFRDTPAANLTTASKVFYATDRTPRENPSSPRNTYTNDREFGLRLGVATVDKAPGMDWAALHEESLLEKRSKDPSPRLTEVEETGPLWLGIPPLQAASVEDPEVAERFAAQVQAELDKGGLDEIFILVHGFNTHFDSNCVVAAELHHYLGSQGVFMSYAWPSRGSLFKYAADKASAAYSIRYFRLFLIYLAEKTTARRINIIAHSAGAPIAVGAIRELCLMHYDEGADAVQKRYRLGQVVLAAPDMDLGVFENATHDGFVGAPESMAIYFSTRDKALDFSSWIFGFARLGEPLTEMHEADIEFLRDHPTVQLIDVIEAEKHHGSWLGHSYFHKDAWVSSDLIMMFRHGADPAARGLVQMKDKPIWVFPKGYPERARAAGRKLYDSGRTGSDR